jgi:hypothetical protein
MAGEKHMSCITELLKMKGDKSILPITSNARVGIEGGGIYKDYEYLITFTDRGHRCGYVAVPPAHPKYDNSEKEYSCEFPVECHGGVTFYGNHSAKDMLEHPCEDQWVGFDAAHGDDKPCIKTAKEYFGETDSIKWLEKNSSIMDDDDWFWRPSVHRTFQYMEQECKSIIDQLIEQEY